MHRHPKPSTLCTALLCLAPAPALAGSWGETWGSMVWGAIAVPVLGTWGTLALGALLGAATVLLPSKAAKRTALAGLAVLVVLPVTVRAVSVPNSFVNGAVADADEVNANFEALADAIGGCYVHGGQWGCASGFDEVVQGRAGGLESYGNSGGSVRSNVECVDVAAPIQRSFSTSYANRLMRSDAEGDGMSVIQPRCSTCCSGGCYTALGTTSCVAGYTKVYDGRAGGIEAYVGGSLIGKTLCVDGAATPQFTWASGYNTRLSRYREGATGSLNGMDFVDNSCAVCCK